MNIEIAVEEINESVTSYILYGSVRFLKDEEEVATGTFVWSQDSGMPSEVNVAIKTSTDVLDDVDVDAAVKQAVSEMFNTGNLIEPGYVFETQTEQ